MPQPIRLLIVEDDTVTRTMLAAALGEPDIDVVVAVDGAHALRTALTSPPDIVLVDIGLPVLDASGFVEQWRERAPAARSGRSSRCRACPSAAR